MFLLRQESVCLRPFVSDRSEHLLWLTVILAKEGVAKGSEKKGTTKSTKSTKKSFSFPLCSLCALWFKAFMLFATPSKAGIHSRGGFPASRLSQMVKSLSCHSVQGLYGNHLVGIAIQSAQHCQRELCGCIVLRWR